MKLDVINSINIIHNYYLFHITLTCNFYF